MALPLSVLFSQHHGMGPLSPMGLQPPSGPLSKAKERQGSAAAHAHSLHLLRAIADHSTDVIFAKDLQGRYLLFSRRAEHFSGQTGAAVLGCDDRVLFKPEQAALLRANDQLVMQQDQAQTFEEDVGTRLGRRVFLTTKAPLHDDNGQVVGLFGIARDITESKRVAAALQVSEERYQLAASQGQLWHWSAASGQISIATDFWPQLDLPPPPHGQELATLASIMHPQDQPRWRAALRAHLLQRQAYSLEFRARHASGQWHWFHTRGQATWDSLGQATHMAGTTFDINPRMQATDALRASEAYRSNLLEQLSDGVLLLGAELQVLDTNSHLLAMLGLQRSELLQTHLQQLLQADQRALVPGQVQALRLGQTALAQWQPQRKDGSSFAAEVSARAVDENLTVLVLRDVSGRLRTQQIMQDYEHELSALARRLLSQEAQTTQHVAQVLHDHLGQTLAVARLQLDVAASRHGHTMSAPLKQHCEKLGLLLDRAVDEVRQVMGNLQPPYRVDLGLAAALVNETRAQALPDGSTGVRLEADDAMTDVQWPAEVAYAAFMVAREAVTNARQHAQAHLVRVLLQGDAGSLRLQVIDDGLGITDALCSGRAGHLGIVGMRERARAIGAHFELARLPEGGTHVVLHWSAGAATRADAVSGCARMSSGFKPFQGPAALHAPPA
jgi:PAS domain S-box-containing protein